MAAKLRLCLELGWQVMGIAGGSQAQLKLGLSRVLAAVFWHYRANISALVPCSWLGAGVVSSLWELLQNPP